MTNERFSEYQAEIKKLEKIDNSNTDMIDRKESMKEVFNGIESLDADLVYDTLNMATTVNERICKKWYELEVSAKCNGDTKGAEFWNIIAKEKESAAKELRQILTHLFRMQKGNNKVYNLKKQMGDE